MTELYTEDTEIDVWISLITDEVLKQRMYPLILRAVEKERYIYV